MKEKLLAFFKIIRPVNFFITFISVIVAATICLGGAFPQTNVFLAAISAALTLAAGNILNDINTSEPVSNFIGVADRVILRSRKDRTIIDSENDIILNTTADSKVKIGGDTDMSPIPQGDKLVNVLDKIAQILAQGKLVQGSVASPIAKTSLIELDSMINEIKSKNYFIKKNSYFFNLTTF